MYRVYFSFVSEENGYGEGRIIRIPINIFNVNLLDKLDLMTNV